MEPAVSFTLLKLLELYRTVSLTGIAGETAASGQSEKSKVAGVVAF